MHRQNLDSGKQPFRKRKQDRMMVQQADMVQQQLPPPLPTALRITRAIFNHISRRLAKAVLHSYKPLCHASLTPQQSFNCSVAAEYHDCQPTSTTFSDEYRFSLKVDEYKIRVWRGQGQR